MDIRVGEVLNSEIKCVYSRSLFYFILTYSICIFNHIFMYIYLYHFKLLSFFQSPMVSYLCFCSQHNVHTLQAYSYFISLSPNTHFSRTLSRSFESEWISSLLMLITFHNIPVSLFAFHLAGLSFSTVFLWPDKICVCVSMYYFYRLKIVYISVEQYILCVQEKKNQESLSITSKYSFFTF